MPNNLDRLPVTIVNNDKDSKSLENNIKKKLSFKNIHVSSDLSKAKKQLSERKTYLIINIPKNFKNKPKNLNFYINESNPSSVVSAMKTTASTLGDAIKEKVLFQTNVLKYAKPKLIELEKQLNLQKQNSAKEVAQKKLAISQAPKNQQKLLSSQLNTSIKEQKRIGKQKAVVEKNKIINDAKKKASKESTLMTINIKIQHNVKQGLNYSLSPFFATLALYLSSLLGSLVLYGTFVKFSKQIGKIKSFVYLETTMSIVSVIGALTSTIMVTSCINHINFLNLFINSFLVLFASLNLNSIMVFLMGQLGTSINILLTMIQIVASSGMFPVSTMNGFFKFIHNLSPMYYGVSANFNIINGGNSVNSIWIKMIVLIISIILINVIIVSIKKKQIMLDFNSIS